MSRTRFEGESCPRAADRVKRTRRFLSVSENLHMLHDYCYIMQLTRMGSSAL